MPAGWRNAVLGFAGLTLMPLPVQASCGSAYLSGAAIKARMDQAQREVSLPDGYYYGTLTILGRDFPLLLSLTSKGNGTLEVANLLLRIYRVHADAFMYQGGALDIEISDRGTDQCYLTVSGVIELLNEDGEVRGRNPAQEIFLYDPQAGRFTSVYRNSPVDFSLRQ